MCGLPKKIDTQSNKAKFEAYTLFKSKYTYCIFHYNLGFIQYAIIMINMPIINPKIFLDVNIMYLLTYIDIEIVVLEISSYKYFGR